VSLQDFFWVALAVAGFALVVWLVVLVLRDVFGRDDLSAGGKLAWSLLAILLPIVGSLSYLATQRASPAALRTRSSRRRNAGLYE
jgi:hypothetical protein